MSIDSKLLAHVLQLQVDSMEIAEMSADGRATGEVISLVVKDRHDRSIVLGHALIAMFIGSEQAIRQIKEAIVNAEGTTERK